MGRLSKHQKEFKKKMGVTPLEFARMIRRKHSEELYKKMFGDSD